VAIKPSNEMEPSDEPLLFRGSRFNVRQVEATLPDGTTIQKQVIRHPGAVVILPLLADGRVVLIRNFRYSVARTLLELPAGTMEPPELPALTATRELTEETGYIAGKMEFIQSFLAAPGNCDEQMHLFVATDLQPSSPRREVGEQIENEILTWPEINAQLATGQIEDAKTLVGLLLARRRFPHLA